MDTIVKPILRRNVNSPNKRAVRCIETGITYSCGRDAADILSEKEIIVSPEDIRKVCRGQRHTAGGYHWEYVE